MTREELKDIIKECILESKDLSNMQDDFKKKSGKSFKLINLYDNEALKYVSKEWRNDKYAEIAVCKEDDKLAGYIYINKSGTIAPFLIKKEYRGYGLSNKLLEIAINKYKGRKLGVYSDNEIAIKLYKKYGFVETERKIYKDGDEVIIMELKNKPPTNN